MEREGGPRHVTARFLGSRVGVAKGAYVFAQATDAVVVPFACTSTGFLKWRLWFGEGMHCGDGAGVDSNKNMQRAFQQLDPVIQEHPEQIPP